MQDLLRVHTVGSVIASLAFNGVHVEMLDVLVDKRSVLRAVALLPVVGHELKSTLASGAGKIRRPLYSAVAQNVRLIIDVS